MNPLIVDKLANTIKPGLGDSMNSSLKNFKESSLNTAADKYVNSNDPVEKVGLALMLGIGSVALPESVTDLELSAALGGVSKAYAPEIAAGANKVDDAANGLWSKLFGGSTEVANPIPETFARVIPGSKSSGMLGLPGSSDVFVTDAKVLQGLTPSQISSKLAIDSDTTFTIIEFPSKGIDGIASPINRDYSKFIGGGKTAGGAPEFVIPNTRIPNNSTIKIIKE